MTTTKPTQGEVDAIMQAYDRNPDRAAEILDHPDPSVRRKSALSLKTPSELLVELSFDVDSKVQLAVLNNPNTPKATRERLLGAEK